LSWEFVGANMSVNWRQDVELGFSHFLSGPTEIVTFGLFASGSWRCSNTILFSMSKLDTHFKTNLTEKIEQQNFDYIIRN
jgi:hypothetical protein